MTLLNLLLAAGKGSQPNPLGSLPFLIAMIAVMYFFMLRPQMKRAKEQKEFSNTTNLGDVVVTTSGIHGKIVRVNEDGTVNIEIDRNTVVKMEKSSISMEMTVALRKRNATETKAA